MRKCLLLLFASVVGYLSGANPSTLSVGVFAGGQTLFSWNSTNGNVSDWTTAFTAQLGEAFRRNGFTLVTNANISVMGRVVFDEKSSPAVTVGTEVRDVATGAVRWNDSTVIETQFFAVTNLAMFVAATSEAAAQTVADKLAVRLRPYRVLARETNGRLVIGNGFGSLRVGECLTVFSPDTHPSAIGTAQVVAVTSTGAKAVLIEREVAEIPLGSTLRRVPLRDR